MEHLMQKVEETNQFLTAKGFTGAKTAIVLGTGLGSLIKQLETIHQVSYNDIPHFVSSTVEFHKGQLLLGSLGGTRVIIMQGRFHYYEGYTMQEVTFPIRVLKALGIECLLLSNAAGGINSKFKKGDLVLIDDHINLQPGNPLIGLNDPALGNRFVDMCCPYDKGISIKIKYCAMSLKIKLRKGIYVAVAGPNLETRAEYRFLRTAGADMVGMSTVPEVIVANHIGLPCAAISIITDECNPDDLKPVSIEEIIKVAEKADKKLTTLLISFLAMQ
ncbi:MAG: purine-nucleoside phosphorylase [Ferruginibacter sp.]